MMSTITKHLLLHYYSIQFFEHIFTPTAKSQKLESPRREIEKIYFSFLHFS